MSSLKVRGWIVKVRVRLDARCLAGLEELVDAVFHTEDVVGTNWVLA